MSHGRDAGGGVILNIGSYAPDVGGNGIKSAYAATISGGAYMRN